MSNTTDEMMDCMDDMYAIVFLIETHNPDLHDKLAGIGFDEAAIKICNHYDINVEKVKTIDDNFIDLSKLLTSLSKKIRAS